MTDDAIGTLIIDIADHMTNLSLVGGASHDIPLGPRTLYDGDLGAADLPSPAQLTNALGRVHDHLDDVLIAAPTMGAPSAVVLRGRHARGLAQVELGSRSIPDGYRLARTDADEVFRIVATEDPARRIHNPGLDPDHVQTIIATCCIALSIMRRLDLDAVGVDGEDADRSAAVPGAPRSASAH
jgi:exopolyphosphatase/guanosine-5'-triphosphate,3'-diphosphate pyrophosphatase